MTEHRRDARGFTLLEVLVVLMIFGVVAAVALLSWRPALPDDNAARVEALRLAERLRLASDLTMLSGRRFGLVLDAQGYQLLERVEDGSWRRSGDADLDAADARVTVAELVVEGRAVALRAASLAGRGGSGDIGDGVPVLRNDPLGDWPDFALRLTAGQGPARSALEVVHRAPGRFDLVAVQ